MNDCEVRGICLLCTQQKESLKVCLLEIQKRNSLQSFYMALFSNPVPALPQMPLLAYPAPSAPQNLLGRRRQRHQQEAAPGSTVLSRSCLLEMNAHRRAGAGHNLQGTGAQVPGRQAGWEAWVDTKVPSQLHRGQSSTKHAAGPSVLRVSQASVTACVTDLQVPCPCLPFPA